MFLNAIIKAIFLNVFLLVDLFPTTRNAVCLPSSKWNVVYSSRKKWKECSMTWKCPRMLHEITTPISQVLQYVLNIILPLDASLTRYIQRLLKLSWTWQFWPQIAGPWVTRLLSVHYPRRCQKPASLSNSSTSPDILEGVSHGSYILETLMFVSGLNLEAMIWTFRLMLLLFYSSLKTLRRRGSWRMRYIDTIFWNTRRFFNSQVSRKLKKLQR